jgi:hydroxybutyrate-dimer hydrolase
MTLSTVGLVPQIKRFADEDIHTKLAISLHAATDDERDALLPINHTARAWFAKNQSHGGNVGNTRYVEVTNAQHFDSFIGFGVLLGYDTRYIPLHVYFNRALDAMWAHLKDGTALPPSQVVRTVPRGGVSGAAPALTAVNVPPIQAGPGAGDLIGFSGNTLSIPD